MDCIQRKSEMGGRDELRRIKGGGGLGGAVKRKWG